MHGFLDWIADAADWLLTFSRLHPESAFAVAFIVSFGESFAGLSFLVPGTTILIALGALLRAIDAEFFGYFLVWLAAAVGAILGDWISYWIGFHYHHQILHIWPFKKFEDQIEKGLHLFHRWGVWAIFIGRFLGPLRATVPLVAGMSELEFWPFQAANTLSAIVWAFALLAPAGAVLRHLIP